MLHLMDVDSLTNITQSKLHLRQIQQRKTVMESIALYQCYNHQIWIDVESNFRRNVSCITGAILIIKAWKVSRQFRYC